MRQDDTFDEGLTSEELAAISGLTSERIPPAELKARTVRALTDARRLRASRRITPRLTLLLASAASVVFLAGATLGYAAAMRRVEHAKTEITTSAPARAVARIEPTDSAAKSKRQVVWF